VVLFGSSLVASATFSADAQHLQQVRDCVLNRDGAAFASDLSKSLGRPVRVFNSALGGAMISDAYMYSQAMFQSGMKPKVVIVGIAPRDFIDNGLPGASATEPFRFCSKFVDLGNLKDHATSDFFAKMGWVIDKELPLSRLKRNLLGEPSNESVVEEKAKADSSVGNKVLQAISAIEGEQKPGVWLIPANMPPIFQDNMKEYINRYKNPNPPIYKDQIAFFEAFLANMRDNDIKVVVVQMPLLAPNRSLLPDTFWKSYDQKIATLCKEYDAHFENWADSDYFVVDDFLDTVHMNASGGLKFYSRLSSVLNEDSSCVVALKQGSPAQIAGVKQNLK
jgi:hypothetical protein